MTLCTAPRILRVEDPIASEPNPQVRQNPPPRRQREVWQAARQGAFAALAVVVLAAIIGYFLARHRARPRPEPPKPKTLPWVLAWRRLTELEHSPMLSDEAFDAFFDEVDECVRRYLGERYGFDGVESTGEEIQWLMQRVRPVPPALDAILAFLRETDFIKFADVEPSLDDCSASLLRAKALVQQTMPPGLGQLDRLKSQGDEAA